MGGEEKRKGGGRARGAERCNDQTKAVLAACLPLLVHAGQAQLMYISANYEEETEGEQDTNNYEEREG